jgi:hypothetical protein
LQILFGDGTQQLASFNKVKLLSCSVPDDDDDDDANASTTPTTNTNNSKPTKLVGASSSSSNANNSIKLNTTTTSTKIVNNNHNCGSQTSNNLHQHNLQQHNHHHVAVLVNEEVTCGSCGVVKKVTGKKALNYAPHTKDQFNCRRCVNKSRFCKSRMPIPSTPTVSVHNITFHVIWNL